MRGRPNRFPSRAKTATCLRECAHPRSVQSGEGGSRDLGQKYVVRNLGREGGSCGKPLLLANSATTASLIVHADPQDGKEGQGEHDEGRERGGLADFLDSPSRLFLSPVHGNGNLSPLGRCDFIRRPNNLARIAIPASWPDSANSAVNQPSIRKDVHPIDSQGEEEL